MGRDISNSWSFRPTAWFDGAGFEIGSNMLIVLVGGSTIGKSTSFELPYMKCFKELAVPSNSTKGKRNWHERWKKYGLNDPLRIAADRITSQKMVVNLAQLGHVDMTLTSFADSEPFYDSSASLLVSEFGTFMKVYDEDTPKFLTEMWDRRPDYNHETKTGSNKEIYIRAPCLNAIFGATPGQFIDNLPKNVQNQGFLSRLLVVYDPRKFKETGFPKPGWTPGLFKALREDLAEISKIKGAFDWEGGREGSFFKEVNEWIIEDFEPKPMHPRLLEYNGRRKAHFVKVAMSVSASKRNDRLITPEDWEETKGLMFEIEATMPIALFGFGMSEIGKSSMDLLSELRNSPKGMTIRDFNRKVMRTARSVTEAQSLPKAMEDAGLIKIDGLLVRPGKNLTW